MTLEGDQLSSHPLGPQWGLPRPLTSRCQQLSSRQNFKKHFNEHWSKGMRGASTRIRHRTRATLSGNQRFATSSLLPPAHAFLPRLKTWVLQSNSCHQALLYHIQLSHCSLPILKPPQSHFITITLLHIPSAVLIKALLLRCAAGFYIDTIPAQMIMARNAACTTYNFWP